METAIALFFLLVTVKINNDYEIVVNLCVCHRVCVCECVCVCVCVCVHAMT